MSRIALGAAILLTIGEFPGSAEELRRFEIRRAVSTAPGKLVAYVGDREVNLSTDALQAWPGWHEDVLLYSEQRRDGKYELRSFNAITGARRKITVERKRIADITVARLANGEYTLVLSLRDSSGNDPSLALAHPTEGVFRRVPHATAGAIVNDTVVLHIFRPMTRAAKLSGDSQGRLVRVATIPLGRN